MLWAGFVSLAALSVGVGAQDRVAARACFHHPNNGGTIYDFSELDLFENRNVSLDEYRGQVVLIVNVATYCGYTAQYHDMNVLQSSYSNFSILGFPCNQFGKQEPAANATELYNGIKYVRPGNLFEPNFTLLKKVEVNGENEHPLFTYLKEFCPTTRETFADPARLYYKPIHTNDIRWNWEKFLITKSGKPFMRYDPGTKPEEIRNDVAFLLEQDF